MSLLHPDGPAGLVATLTRLVVETVRPGIDELTVGVGVIRAGRWFEDIRLLTMTVKVMIQ